MQGVTPALLAHEMLLRLTPLDGRRAPAWIGIAAALAFSAIYELIEMVGRDRTRAGARKRSSARRATCGTPEPTCSARCSARSATVRFLFPAQRRDVERNGWMFRGTPTR
jgi:hypothetical protein